MRLLLLLSVALDRLLFCSLEFRLTSLAPFLLLSFSFDVAICGTRKVVVVVVNDAVVEINDDVDDSDDAVDALF